MTRRSAVACAIAAVSAALVVSPAGAQPSEPATITAPPGAIAYGFVPPVVVIEVGQPLVFENGDDRGSHNVTARLDAGPDDEEWCSGFADGTCPVLWSRTIPAGISTPVLGTENLEPASVYPLFCTLHPWMNGFVVTAP